MNPDNPIEVLKDNMESFRTSWSHFTPELKGMKIIEKKLVPFFIDLKPPLGFGKHQDPRLVAK